MVRFSKAALEAIAKANAKTNSNVLVRVKHGVRKIFKSVFSNNLTLSHNGQSAAMDAVTALLNAGGAGTINIYTGSQPSGPDTAISGQTLLATLTFSSTSFAASSSGVATANTITSESSAPNTGTAQWARMASGAGTAVMDCTVGTSGCDINFPTTAINSGDTVSISALTLTHP